MPRRKKVKSEDIKGFDNEDDESLIVHLPIKVKDDNINNSIELLKLKKENKELKEKLSNILASNLNNVSVIKNTCNCSDIKCWWCDGFCSENKIILPEKKINKSFYGNGNFCSFNCAMSFNLEKQDEKVWDRCSLLYQLKENITNISNKKINPAPPKEVLKDYGGELSRDEYNNLLFSIDYSFIKLLPPMISSTILIEQRNKNNNNNLSQLNLLGLKLKRSKTPAKNKFSLDSILS